MDYKKILGNITPEYIDSLTIEDRQTLVKTIAEIRERKSKYPILDYVNQPYQQEFEDVIKEKNEDWTPKYKFIIFIGWNWSWKTLSCARLTMLKALWDYTKELNLPFVWRAPTIKIATSTWSQIQENLEPYILWTETPDDIIKFPWYFSKQDLWPYVKKVRKDKEILKEITLNNGTTIFFGSYDQWQARLQGSSPDFIWLDEIPTRWADFRELIRGTRKNNTQFLMSFTPTNYNRKIYDWIYWGEDNKFVRKINSLDNKLADHSWLSWLSEDELRIVRDWDFTPPTWLVYKNFNRDFNVVEYFDPKRLWNWVKFYWAIDFWVKHKTSFLFIGIDSDWHIYVFDSISESGVLLSDLSKEILRKKREYWIDFEWIVADSAWARERLELKELWIYTTKAKKRKKEWNLSNRKGWILKINQLLSLWKLIISDKCKDLIDEFQTHHYKEKGEDWTVEKEWDDNLDALRYFIFNYHSPSETQNLKKKRNKITKKVAKQSDKY